MKCIHPLVLLIIFLTFFSAKVSFAQEDFEKWLKKEDVKFNKYLSEEDKKFTKFLEKEWKEFQLQQGLVFDKKPKPVDFPKYKPQKKKSPIELLDKLPPVKIPEIKPIQRKNKEPNVEISKKEIPKIKVVGNLDLIKFKYYGSDQSLNLPKNFNIKLKEKVNNKSISNFWFRLSSFNTKFLLNQLVEKRNLMQLNDWGYLMYLYNVAATIYTSAINERHMLVWFLLNKSGYKARVCILGNSVYIVLPSRNKIFSTSFISGAEETGNYYIFDLENILNQIKGSIYTFAADYPGADKELDMAVLKPIEIGTSEKNKTLTFSYQGKEFTVPVRYNPNNINFFKNYPYTNLKVYFNSSLNSDARTSLLTSLKTIINGKSEPVAANMLLRFVQTAFGYKTDQLNFGREKPLFPEETLYYSNSDCEDRAVLYSYLIKNLLGLEVLGLDYPGHVATAVKFNVPVPGDKITYKGNTYTICDPTYINAYIGMSMPQLKGVQLENIIELKY